MEEHYVSAAVRHALDADRLFQQGRLDNAAYLAGYGVECSLKAVVELGGGMLPKMLGHHLVALQGAALELANLLSPGIRRYRVGDEPDVRFLAQNWVPSLRYEESGAVTAEVAGRFVSAARICVDRIVYPMILDGLAGAFT